MSKRLQKRSNALYIHIPFCQALCSYCDFCKMLYESKRADRYLDQLFLELDSFHIEKVDTIYIGGGTPTSLSINQLTRLLEKVSPLLANGGEFTCEANFENLSFEKLKIMKSYQVNRLSLGVQTFDPLLLSSLNRLHQVDDVKYWIIQARNVGFDNINIDLIHDLPGANLETLKKDLDIALSLDVEHISTYALSIHPGTVLGINKIQLAPEEESRANYELIVSTLRSHGYSRYEVSNFAKEGKQSLHNQVYWNNEPYYGIGLGAGSYLNGWRYQNTRNLTTYLKGKYIESKERITKEIEEEYFLLLKLRKEIGFSEKEFFLQFGYHFKNKYHKEIAKLTNSNLLLNKDGYWRASDEGIILLDYLLLNLLK